MLLSECLKLNRVDPDKALLQLGENGRYQIFLFVLISTQWYFVVFQIMSIAFIGSKQEFTCRSESGIGMNGSGDPGNFDGACSLFIHNDTEVSCGNNGTFLDFDHTYGTTIVDEFELVCDRNFLAESSGSLFMFGIMVGDLIITSAADRFGRRLAFLGSLWSTGLFGALAAVAPSYVTFAIFRFLTGCFYSGTIMVGWVLGCECVPARMRAYGLVLMGVFWTTGYCLLGVLAYFIRSWRLLSLIISLQVAVTFSYYWLVPEGLHWLVANNEVDKTVAWISKAEKFNKINISLEDCMHTDVTEASQKKKVQKRTILDAFTNPLLACYTVGVSYLWVCDTFVYYGLSLFSTNLGGDRYVDFILSGGVELPAYLIVAPLLNRIGRRSVVCAAHVFAGLSLLALMFVPKETASGTSLQPVIVFLWLMGKFSISCAFCSIYVLCAEIFPTTLRGAAMGFFGVISRLGGMLAPFVGLIQEFSEFLPPLLFGSCSLLAALVTASLPETLHKRLPEDIDEVHPSPMFSFLLARKRKRNSPDTETTTGLNGTEEYLLR